VYHVRKERKQKNIPTFLVKNYEILWNFDAEIIKLLSTRYTFFIRNIFI